jgi:hypothetical protein
MSSTKSRRISRSTRLRILLVCRSGLHHGEENDIPIVLASIVATFRRLCFLINQELINQFSGTYRSNAVVGLIKGSNVSWVFVVLYNVLVIASSDNRHGRCTSTRDDGAGGSSAYKGQHGGIKVMV